MERNGTVGRAASVILRSTARTSVEPQSTAAGAPAGTSRIAFATRWTSEWVILGSGAAGRRLRMERAS